MTSFRDRFEKRIPSRIKRAMETGGNIAFEDKKLIEQAQSLAHSMGISLGEYIEEALRRDFIIMQWWGMIAPLGTLFAKTMAREKMEAANMNRGPQCVFPYPIPDKPGETTPCTMYQDDTIHQVGPEEGGHTFTPPVEEPGEDPEAFRERLKKESGVS